MIIKPSRIFQGSDLGLDPTVVISGADVAEVIEESLGAVQWISETEGFCECPGRHLHTTRDGKKDCKIYLHPVASLSCFHGSCREVVRGTAMQLRQSIADFTGVKAHSGAKLTEEQKEQMAKLRAREALRHRAASTRGQIISEFTWKYDQILKDSPAMVGATHCEHWRDLLMLFESADVLWIGAVYDSGKPPHAAHFRSRDEWLGMAEAPGQFICASTFKPGSHSRGNDNVAGRPFLVVESDELDRDTIGSVFRWMQEKLTMKLRCIVDTAGKSLHGWFNFPASEVLDDLKVVLPEFGCDPKMFTASQPCRLPGAVRDGRYQRLIYLNPEVQP